MFIILLRFSENKNLATEYMEGHNAWLKSGMDDNVFILAGSLQPNQGGAILAHNTTIEELHNRVNNDPFVSEKVVSFEIMEITPAMTDKRLEFLKV